METQDPQRGLRDISIEKEAFGLVLHSQTSHVSRLVTYVSSKYSNECQVIYRASEPHMGITFILLNSNPHETVKQIYQDPLVLRYTQRFYLFTNVADDLSFVTPSLFKKTLDVMKPESTDNGRLRLRIVAYPTQTLQKTLIDLLEERQEFTSMVTPAPKNFTHFFSVFEYGNRYFYAVLPTELFWVRDESKYIVDSPISRAYYKLREAVDRAGVKFEPNWKAIDLGASPGGWTKFLAEKMPEGSVVAIDPGKLRIDMTPNIVHLQMKGEECSDYLNQNGPYDVLVCDIGRTYDEIKHILADAVKYLRSGGIIIWTLKLPNRREWSPALAALLQEHTEALKKQFADILDNIQIFWLMANRNERTVVATKK